MEKENLRQNNIIWNLAVRDDEYVAKHVKDNKEMDAIYSLKEAGLLDEFFQFLQEMNIIELIKEVKYKDVQREMVEFFQYIFLYICRIILGIKSQNSLPDLLFSNTAAMELVGFNAHQVRNGICNRGDFKRKNKEKQGPICPPTLSNNIVKIPKEEVEELLNKAISKVAENCHWSGDSCHPWSGIVYHPWSGILYHPWSGDSCHPWSGILYHLWSVRLSRS